MAIELFIARHTYTRKLSMFARIEHRLGQKCRLTDQELLKADPGGSIMENDIVVPLRSPQQIREVLPYIHEVAQPGTKVLFFVRSELKPIDLLTEQLVLIRTGIDYSLFAGMNQHAVAQQQASLAKEKVFTACESLAKRGIEIDITVYRGSLRRILRKHVRKENVQLVIMSPARRRWGLSLLHIMGSLWGFSSLTSWPPVLLLHLSRNTMRYPPISVTS